MIIICIYKLSTTVTVISADYVKLLSFSLMFKNYYSEIMYVFIKALSLCAIKPHTYPTSFMALYTLQSNFIATGISGPGGRAYRSHWIQ